MVEAQNRLLTEHLGINHLRLVMGTSMGGMHTWMWGYLWPDFMDALLPLASLPAEIAGRNRMLRRMIIDSIAMCPEYKQGNYKTQPRGLRNAVHALLFMVSVPLQWQKEAPTLKSSDEKFDALVADYSGRFDANDMLYHFTASEDYNPAPHLDKIQAPLWAINSADDQVNPPELGILEQEIKRMARGRAIVLPISDHTRGHASHSWPVLWQRYLIELLSQSTP
jgi:homoserine O-acetyltransferase